MSSAFAGKNGRTEQKKDHSEPSWEEKLGGSFILETSGPGDSVSDWGRRDSRDCFGLLYKAFRLFFLLRKSLHIKLIGRFFTSTKKHALSHISWSTWNSWSVSYFSFFHRNIHFPLHFVRRTQQYKHGYEHLPLGFNVRETLGSGRDCGKQEG